MPYIPKDARGFVSKLGASTPGELNYAITMQLIGAWNQVPVKRLPLQKALTAITLGYWRKKKARGFGNYNAINEILGALAGAWMEFDRRICSSNSPDAAFDKFAIAKAIAKVQQDFYAKIAVPYEEKKCAMNGDLPYATE
jgi:hypothetical protein